jgi:hypothetical protein
MGHSVDLQQTSLCGDRIRLPQHTRVMFGNLIGVHLLLRDFGPWEILMNVCTL